MECASYSCSDTRRQSPSHHLWSKMAICRWVRPQAVPLRSHSGLRWFTRFALLEHNPSPGGSRRGVIRPGLPVPWGVIAPASPPEQQRDSAESKAGSNLLCNISALGRRDALRVTVAEAANRRPTTSLETRRFSCFGAALPGRRMLPNSQRNHAIQISRLD